MVELRVVKSAYVPRAGAQMESHSLMWRRRFSVLICHRRMGKTVSAINDSIAKALACRHPNPRVAYLAPFQNQARRVAWSYAQHYAQQYGPLYMRADQGRMAVKLRARDGSVAEFQLLGADNADALRGVYLDDVKVDEAAQVASSVWSDILRPALADRQGSATLMGTPAGRYNLLHNSWEKAPEMGWGRAMFKASETHYLTESELAAMRREMTPEAYEQEMECSFDAGIKGAYYAKLIADARAEGRITNVPHDPSLPTFAAFDLGMRDATAVWICQVVPSLGSIRFIQYLEFTGQTLPTILEALPKHYRWQAMIGPHDLRVRDYGVAAAATRLQIAERLGYYFEICRDVPIADGRDAVRLMLPRCVFDEGNCKRGIEALQMHRALFDEDLQIESREARHDWTSHGADAMRYFAVATNRGMELPDLRSGSGGVDWAQRDRQMKFTA